MRILRLITNNLSRPLTGRAYRSGLSSIVATASISIAILLSALVWEITATANSKEASLHAISNYSKEEKDSSGQKGASENTGASQAGTESAADAKPYDPNDLSKISDDAFGKLIGTYIALKQEGAYTASAGDRAAEEVASSLNAPAVYAPIFQSDIKTDPDTSFERMLQYRSDMRTALEPLLQNTEPEFGLFARYIETRDKSNLAKLSEYALRYKKAAENLKGTTAPKDSVFYHARIANSLLFFATTLEQMAKYADEPLTSLALLRTYNESELEVLTSFNDLASFEKSKKP